MAVFMLAGFFIREKIKPLQRLFLPSSLIAGLLMLACGQQGIGLFTIPKQFNSLPGVLIDVVMASMAFGITFSKKQLHSYLDYVFIPMPVYGMQIFVGTLLGAALRAIWPGLPLGWGIMGVFSFFGGHGNAAAAGAVFNKLGVEGNMAVGMVLSTVGLIAAMIIGMGIVNYGIRRGWGTYVKEPSKQPDYFYGGLLPDAQRKSVGTTVTTGISINHLALQCAWLLGSVFLGNKIFSFLILLSPSFKVFPSVLHGVVGGAVLWNIIRLLKLQKYVDLKTIKMLSGFFLEIVVFSAMATLNLKFISTYAVALTIYSLTIVLLTIPLVLFCARRFCKEEWFEKAMMGFGAVTGNTSTGLALVRAIDPNSQSHAGDSHSVFVTLTVWRGLFVGLIPGWLMNGVGLTAGVGVAFMIGFLALGFKFFDMKRPMSLEH